MRVGQKKMKKVLEEVKMEAVKLEEKKKHGEGGHPPWPRTNDGWSC